MESKIGLFAASFSNEYGVKDAPLQLEDLFVEGYAADKFPNEVLKSIRTEQKQHAQITLAECSEREGRLLYRDKVFVPDYAPLRLRVILEFDNTPTAGHPGRDKTFELVS